MPRIQILELPTIYREHGDDETPFVLVIDQADENTIEYLAHGTTVEYDGTQRPTRDSLKDQLGARAILVFTETVDIPANEAPLGPDGYPVRLRVVGDFEEFRQQVDEQVRQAQERLGKAQR